MLSARVLHSVAVAGACFSGGSLLFFYRYTQNQMTGAAYYTQAVATIRSCPNALFLMGPPESLAFAKVSLLDRDLQVSKTDVKLRIAVAGPKASCSAFVEAHRQFAEDGSPNRWLLQAVTLQCPDAQPVNVLGCGRTGSD